MAASRVARTLSNLSASSYEHLNPGVPENFNSLPAWEKILILASTFKHTDESRANKTSGHT